MQASIAPLKELAEYEELYRERKKEPGMLRVTGCVNSQKTHMMYALSENIRYKVVCAPPAAASPLPAPSSRSKRPPAKTLPAFSKDDPSVSPCSSHPAPLFVAYQYQFTIPDT